MILLILYGFDVFICFYILNFKQIHSDLTNSGLLSFEIHLVVGGLRQSYSLNFSVIKSQFSQYAESSYSTCSFFDPHSGHWVMYLDPLIGSLWGFSSLLDIRFLTNNPVIKTTTNMIIPPKHVSSKNNNEEIAHKKATKMA